MNKYVPMWADEVTRLSMTAEMLEWLADRLDNIEDQRVIDIVANLKQTSLDINSVLASSESRQVPPGEF